MSSMTPQEIVSELDRFIIGQNGAKRAVAIALRNRWRRQQVDEKLRPEITPKNILMIGPTGVGKTEIARRLARLADAPFIKVEATKFTEVGYVGKDVDCIVRDLVEMAVKQTRESDMRKQRMRAEDAAEDRILDVLLPPPRGPGGESQPNPDSTARQAFRKKLREGQLDDREIEIDLAEAAPSMQVMGPSGMEEMAEQLRGMFSQMGQERRRKRKLKIAEAMKLLIDEEAGKLVNDEDVKTRALHNTEQNGIVFIDEIDKVASRSESGGAEVSRQGVQRDLLPLVEGTTVSTKYGMVKTDHILFIARALSDPRRAAVAVGRRLRSHPHQHPRQPGQAVPGAARHRRGHAGVPAGRHPAAGADRLRRQRTHREHWCQASGHGDGAPAGRGQLRCDRVAERHGGHRRRLRERSPGRAQPQRRPLALHPLTGSAAHQGLDPPAGARGLVAWGFYRWIGTRLPSVARPVCNRAFIHHIHSAL